MSLISNIAHKIPSSSSFGTISVSYFCHVDTDDLRLYHINLYKDVVVLEFVECFCVFGPTPFKKTTMFDHALFCGFIYISCMNDL